MLTGLHTDELVDVDLVSTLLIRAIYFRLEKIRVDKIQFKFKMI